MKTVGVLHPGAMGSVVGGCLASVGHRVLWASEGRSDATRARAGRDGLEDVGSLLHQRCHQSGAMRWRYRQGCE